ncbi:hypothetical protein BDM02DRAFT_3182736 [Thelephora ganbajun]|uniref:Uncharacterized protein n=1 Tax=Thelephora ganbajun TaxID=370292 RepID=A0ACB6ZVA1_THEGA|nr:hypothetical protein BDM02DRAFT_3182736 [Thelephora ganbajun]
MSSDSEADPDYVPTAPKNDDSSLSDSASDDEGSAKRIRTSTPKPTTEEEEARKKIEQDRVWQEFKSTGVRQPQHASVTPKLVKVQKRHRFAGEDILEVVQVPEDSEDAKKWPLWSEPGSSNQNTTDVDNPISNPLATPALIRSSGNENSKSRARGPRKPKLVLPSLPTSSRDRAKKLTTLGKSSMDWKAHVNSDGATTKDELEANRRSGGYLGKVEFLQRVSERKDNILEENQPKKRRR